MTATATYSLAELRAAYSALQAGTFAAPPTAAPAPTIDATTLPPPEDFAGVVGVVGISGGVGTTTVALAVAEAIDAARLVEFSDPQSSGLAAASTAELGVEAGWNVGVRHGLRLERCTTPGIRMLPGVDGQVAVLDLGTWTGPRPVVGVAALVMVAACSVPSIRRLNARLEAFHPAVVVVTVITGTPGRTVPRQVVGAFGPALWAATAEKAVLIVPECPALRISGLTPDPLPRPLRTAVTPINDLLEETP